MTASDEVTNTRRRPFRREFAQNLGIAAVLVVAAYLLHWAVGEPTVTAVIHWVASFIFVVVAVRWLIYEINPRWSDKTSADAV